MKKAILLFAVFASLSFKTQEAKKVVISFTVDEIQIVYDALGELPAKKVEAIRFKIYTEATKQLADTIKKK